MSKWTIFHHKKEI